MLVEAQRDYGVSSEEIQKKKEEILELADTDLNAACQMALDWEKLNKPLSIGE